MFSRRQIMKLWNRNPKIARPSLITIRNHYCPDQRMLCLSRKIQRIRIRNNVGYSRLVHGSGFRTHSNTGALLGAYNTLLPTHHATDLCFETYGRHILGTYDQYVLTSFLFEGCNTMQQT